MFVREDSITGKDDATVSVAVAMYRQRKKTLKARYQYALVCLGLLTMFFLLVLGSVYTSPDTETATKPDVVSTACALVIIVGALGYYLCRMAKRDYNYWQEDRFAWCEDIAKEYLCYSVNNRLYSRNEFLNIGKKAHDYREWDNWPSDRKHKVYLYLAKPVIFGWAFLSVILGIVQVVSGYPFDMNLVIGVMGASAIYIGLCITVICLTYFCMYRVYRRSAYDEAVNLYLESQTQ
jgi:hypothetical protein